MHYMKHISHRMQKHIFYVTCLGALGSPECVNTLLPGCTGMHYVTRRSHCMQKHKFSVTSPDAFFVESISVPPEHEK
jgi:hypothetical protein